MSGKICRVSHIYMITPTQTFTTYISNVEFEMGKSYYAFMYKIGDNNVDILVVNPITYSYNTFNKLMVKKFFKYVDENPIDINIEKTILDIINTQIREHK